MLGWDNRMKAYAYAKRGHPPAWPLVHFETAPFIEGLDSIVRAYDWNAIQSLDQIAKADYIRLQDLAKQVCSWGGVPQRRGYSAVWKVIKSAVLNSWHFDAPINSGWTKVASLATARLPNAQTIWDSRVSTSLVWRLDSILRGRHLQPSAILATYCLGLVRGRSNGPGKARARHYHSRDWPNGYRKWPCHFGGSQLVRDIVDLLNDPSNAYPRMPLPDGGIGQWDVFGVGLVLFMDGY